MVDFGEFVNMMINQNNNTLDEKELLEAFRTFDGDDKGYIFSNEIRYVMRHMGESIPEQDINEILQDHQDSRKRKITFEGNKSRTSIKRPPIKRPVIKVANYCQYKPY